MTPVFVALLITASCGSASPGEGPQTVAVDDPRVASLWRAAGSFQREQHGFTPLPMHGQVGLEINMDGGGYDAMLHSSNRPYRTIAFRRTPDGFRWIGEQQSFLGPREFDTADGKTREQITLTYEIENVSGHPVNRLNVAYYGPDEALRKAEALRLEQVRPTLRAWGY